MKKPDFIKLLREPDMLSGKQVAALKQVVSHFPYFINAQVLLCKALHNENHYEFDKQLKQTALVVPDREVLYYYLHQLKPTWLNETTNKITEPSSTLTVTLADEPKPTSTTVELLPELQLPEGVIAPSDQEIIIEEEEALTIAPLDETATTAIVDEVNVIEQSAQEPIVVNDITNEAHSFDEWLNLLSNKQNTIKVVEATKNFEEPLTTIPVEKNITETIAPSIDEKAAIKTQIDEVVAKSNVNNFHGILDRFIKENPSISRPKSEFFNPINMAKQSVEEDEELVTETLANLYYKQGNYKKAIRAYEKLCLLYPSKLAYFATLIKKIKSEIKD